MVCGSWLMVNENWRLQNEVGGVGFVAICKFHSPIINNHFPFPLPRGQSAVHATRLPRCVQQLE